MARFSVLGSAHIRVTGQMVGNTVSRIRQGDVRTSFGGTGLTLAVELASFGHDVAFGTVVSDTSINSMILDSMRLAGIAIHAEYKRLPDAGDCEHFLPNGELWSRIIARPIEKVPFRDKQLAALLDKGDEIIVECCLHPATLLSVVRRAAVQNKRVWVVGATEFGAAKLVPLIVDECRIAGLFLKDDEMMALLQEANGTAGFGNHGRPSASLIARMISGHVVVTKDDIETLRIWDPAGRETQTEFSAIRNGIGSMGVWPEATDRFMAMTINHFVSDPDLFLDEAAMVCGEAIQKELIARICTTPTDPLEARIGVLMRDALTGLGNRHAVQSFLARLQPENPIALLMFDVDHFKRINDTFGHDMGDVVLAALGKLLRDGVRDGDRPFRIGGEELFVILPDTDEEVAREVAERIRMTIESYPFTHGQVTCSVGVVAGLARDFHAMQEKSDQALYAAKHGGRNQVVCASSLEALRSPEVA